MTFPKFWVKPSQHPPTLLAFTFLTSCNIKLSVPSSKAACCASGRAICRCTKSEVSSAESRMTSTARGSQLSISLSYANSPVLCLSSLYTWPVPAGQSPPCRAKKPSGRAALFLEEGFRSCPCCGGLCLWPRLTVVLMDWVHPSWDGCAVVGLYSAMRPLCKGSSAASELWVVLQCRHVPWERL